MNRLLLVSNAALVNGSYRESIGLIPSDSPNISEMFSF